LRRVACVSKEFDSSGKHYEKAETNLFRPFRGLYLIAEVPEQSLICNRRTVFGKTVNFYWEQKTTQEKPI
jgi:hypothetical protein